MNAPVWNPEFAIWQNRFEPVIASYERLVQAVAAPGNLALVGTDVIGNQSLTLELYAHFAPRLRALIAAGAELIVPIPDGDLPAATVWRQLVALLGTERFTVGIPSNKAPWSPGELRQFLAQTAPSAVHLLGMSPRRGRAFDERVAVIRQLAPACAISCDANRIAALMGENRPASRDIKDMVEQTYDDAVCTGPGLGESWFWHAVAIATAPAEDLEVFADEVGLYGADRDAFYALVAERAGNDAFFDLVEERVFGGDREAMEESLEHNGGLPVESIFASHYADLMRPAARRSALAVAFAGEHHALAETEATAGTSIRFFFSGLSEKRDFAAGVDARVPIGVSLGLGAATDRLCADIVQAVADGLSVFVDTGVFGAIRPETREEAPPQLALAF